MSNEKPSLLSAIKSVAAAMFGVQKEENRQRDFQQGSPLVYIIIGIIFIIAFLATLFVIVSTVLSQPI